MAAVDGTVVVVGAGTMGAGIAQVAAVAGHPVVVIDAAPGAAARAVDAVVERVQALVAKGRLDCDPARLSLQAGPALADAAGAAVVVEAVVEDLAVKRDLFAQLERVVDSSCLLATNTSSLSPTAIAAGLEAPERLVGMHFFNPVPLMRLVEVVPGLATSEETVEEVAALATAWGKTVVRSTPTPGFIVNRVARPFYAEAWRVYEERAAAPEVVDAVITGAGGFRMGPFALMDLIGHDVNLAVTRSVWAALGHNPRYTPSVTQQSLVDAGRLGRKSGQGIYPGGVAPVRPEPSPGAPREPDLVVTDHGGSGLEELLDRGAVRRQPGTGPAGTVELDNGVLLLRCDGRTATAVASDLGADVVVVDRALDDGAATSLAVATSDGLSPARVEPALEVLRRAVSDVQVIDDVPGLVLTRTVAALVNAAVDAVHSGVATEDDVDTAMRLGTGYPIGPLEWGRRWGFDVVEGILLRLEQTYADGHFRVDPLLSRWALRGRRSGEVER